MKTRPLLGAAFAACLALQGGAARADDKATPAQVQAFVQRAVAFIKANGADKAYDEFTNGKSFKERDLYIFVYDLSGKCLAHGANANWSARI